MKQAEKIEMPPLPEEALVNEVEEQRASESQEAPDVAQAQPAEQPAKKEQPKPEESFRQLRQKAEKAERERDEAFRMLKELETKKPVVEEEDLSFNLGADEIAEGKHLSKVDKKIKNLEQKLKQYEQRTVELTTEARLKSQYPDFDEVVNPETIEAFKDADPETASILSATADMYTKAVAVYKNIKRMNLSPQPEPAYESDRLRALRNAAKPKPAASISPQQAESPMSRVNAFAEGLTLDLQKQLRKEMEEARRGY